MELWSNLETILGCSLCGSTVRPVVTVLSDKDHTKADLCQPCYDKSKKFDKFNDGIAKGEITVKPFG